METNFLRTLDIVRSSVFLILRITASVSETLLPAPPHEPGLLPKWLAAKGVNEIIAGGMGQRAIQLFEQHNVTVNLGVRAQGDYQSIVDQYIRQTLETGDNSCNH
ncbi:MAG: NifB/NifX family molybdenum-iron cluster-binding protein [Bacteroidales bacterium]|nr:NifB/NifX family molybdenum-iron cluster-binding protein [Bacteroidales bacterium]